MFIIGLASLSDVSVTRRLLIDNTGLSIMFSISTYSWCVSEVFEIVLFLL